MMVYNLFMCQIVYVILYFPYISFLNLIAIFCVLTEIPILILKRDIDFSIAYSSFVETLKKFPSSISLCFISQVYS